MNIVTDGTTILAKHITEHDWKDNLCFFSEPSDYIQAGTWNYPKGKLLAAHYHNVVPRHIDRTYEVLYVKSGKLRASIYTIDMDFVQALIIQEGEFLILLSCGHAYEILEEHTKVLEIKNGPYPGAEIDRTRF